MYMKSVIDDNKLKNDKKNNKNFKNTLIFICRYFKKKITLIFNCMITWPNYKQATKNGTFSKTGSFFKNPFLSEP